MTLISRNKQRKIWRKERRMSKKKVTQQAPPNGDQSEVQKRINDFLNEEEKLQKKYAVELYAVQVMQPNGEILSMIKVRDILKFNIAK